MGGIIVLVAICSILAMAYGVAKITEPFRDNKIETHLISGVITGAEYDGNSVIVEMQDSDAEIKYIRLNNIIGHVLWVFGDTTIIYDSNGNIIKTYKTPQSNNTKPEPPENVRSINK
ncbi:hypothetical protein M0R01_03670 [bacterium]|nr:hypothetical protein [bacterium]